MIWREPRVPAPVCNTRVTKIFKYLHGEVANSEYEVRPAASLSRPAITRAAQRIPSTDQSSDQSYSEVESEEAIHLLEIHGFSAYALQDTQSEHHADVSGSQPILFLDPKRIPATASPFSQRLSELFP